MSPRRTIPARGAWLSLLLLLSACGGRPPVTVDVNEASPFSNGFFPPACDARADRGSHWEMDLEGQNRMQFAFRVLQARWNARESVPAVHIYLTRRREDPSSGVVITQFLVDFDNFVSDFRTDEEGEVLNPEWRTEFFEFGEAVYLSLDWSERGVLELRSSHAPEAIRLPLDAEPRQLHMRCRGVTAQFTDVVPRGAIPAPGGV